MTVIEVSARGAVRVAVRVAVPTTPPLVAVIVEVPGPTAVANPVELIVATSPALEIH